MQHCVAFTLRQKVVMNLLFVLLMVIGAFTLLRMPVERYPNIQFGKMYINTYLPGASPEDVEILVTKKIEDGLEDSQDIEYIRSSSYRERSSIVIKFNDDSDYEKRFDDVRLKVLSIAGDLPEAAEPPVFNFLDVNDWFPTISVNVAGDHANRSLSLVAEEIKIPLSQLQGVREVKLSGDFTQEFHVLLSRDKLRRQGITYLETVAALRDIGVSYPAGHVETDQGEFIVRVDEQFSSREELFAAVIRNDGDGSLVRLGDLVDDGYFSYRSPFIMASLDGKDCVTLQILKHPQGNALFIAGKVRQVIEELRPVYENYGVTLSVTQDSSSKIEDSIRVLGVNLLLGIALVCIIIWAFMGFRNAALTTIGIPFAFLVTMVLMYLTGNSINEVSLFAFVLVSGIIVDDAIVVVENIYRHVQTGKDTRAAVIDGTAEVLLPVVSATLTTVVAFLPMLIMTGMVGDFFEIIPKTVAFALAASLLECLLILPCHYLEFGPRVRKLQAEAPLQAPSTSDYADGFAGNEGRLMAAFRGVVHRAILVTLRFRILSLLMLTVLFVAAVVIFAGSLQGRTGLMRISFFPDDYSLYYAELTGPPGTPLERTHGLVKKVATELAATGPGEVESALGFAGYYINEDFSPQYGANLGYVAVTLPPLQERHFSDNPGNDVIRHLDVVRQSLQDLVPSDFHLSVRPEKDGPPSGKDINIRVLGINAENVSALASTIERYLREDKSLSPWLLDLQDDQGSDARVLRLRVDGDRVGEWGLTVGEVARLAASAMEGQFVGEMRLPDETVDIRVKPLAEGEDQMFLAGDLPLVDLPAGTLRLGDVTHAELRLEPGYLNRFQRQRAVTLTANLRTGAPLTGPMVVRDVEQFYSKIRADYPGAGLNFSGEYESTQKSFTSLAYAFIIAIVVIYLILAAQFQSYLQPLIIITAVVFALIGVVLGTVSSRTLFTVNSFVAVIGVTGVVVNDSLVLVEFINRCYREGRSRRDALLRATHIRLRPILLTTLTTTLGLLPMALGIPEYSVIWGSMAMTFVTGLCTATFLTILLIPVLWDIVTKMQERANGPYHH